MLEGAVLEAFSGLEVDLDRLLFLKLKKHLTDVVGDLPFQQAAYKLIIWLDSQGLVDKFLDAILAAPAGKQKGEKCRGHDPPGRAATDDTTGTEFQYFTNFVRRWGVPEGVGKLTEEEARCRESTYKFSLRDGLVQQVQIVNGSGNPTAYRTTDPFSYLEEDLETQTLLPCQWDFFYDEDKNLVREAAIDKHRRMISRKTYDDSSDRRETTVDYQVEACEIGRAPSRSGAAFVRSVRITAALVRITAALVRITRSVDGFDDTFNYYDNNVKPKSDAQGSFGKLRFVTTRGLPNRVISLGPQGEKRLCKQGYAIVTFNYDYYRPGTVLARCTMTLTAGRRYTARDITRLPFHTINMGM